jgi:hypothetical protein
MNILIHAIMTTLLEGKSVILKLLIALLVMGIANPALAAGRGYFGAWFGYLPETENVTQTGVIVKKVYQGMAAQKAGLKAGEIITQINGVSVPDPPTAVALLAENAAGEKIRLTVIDRTADGLHRSDVFVVLGDKPTPEFAKLKKTSAPCPSPTSPSCNEPGKSPGRANVAKGPSAWAVAGWVFFVLSAVTGFWLLSNVIRRPTTALDRGDGRI